MSNPDKEKVMPPKKSKAARKTDILEDRAAGGEPHELPDQNGHADDAGKVSDVASSSGLDQEVQVNIFKEEIVEGKRKRNAPVAEQTLLDWLKKNFVEKENGCLSKNDMYQSYLEFCSSAATFAMDFIFFHKAVNQMFPKGMALVEDSPYTDAIREQKPKKKSTSKIQADSLNLKMKDIIKETIVELGDPRKGIMFSVIKNHIAGKHPALRVDLRTNFLKNAVIRAHRLGQIDCVRGVGACGCYRLPRTAEKDIEEREIEKKEAQEKLLKKKQKKNPQSSDEKTDETAEEGKTDATEKEDAGDKSEGAAKDTEEKAKEKTPKKKKKAKHHKKPQEDYYAAHSEPQHIEDTFPLAMTYNSEPKEASVAKIRKYLKDFYKDDVSIEKLKKCLDGGVEHGFWFQVTGHGSGSGSFRLTINEFDPLADDDLTGQVMNAIVACTEPKQSSALLLKKYVQDYHPNFRVAERPHLFKKALQRAVAKNLIIQLSGIGATGTFQLVSPFLPRPTVLQGNDTDDGFAESEVEGGENVASFLDAYKPRPTKRRGMGRPGATAVDRLDPSVVLSSQAASSRASKGRATKKSSRTGGRGSGKKYADSSSESEEEELDEKPQRKVALPAKRRAGAASAHSTGAGKAKKSKLSKPVARKVSGRSSSRQVKAEVTPESESEEYDSEPEIYTPRKTTSRDGIPSSSTAKSRQKGAVRAAPVSNNDEPAKGKKGKAQSKGRDEVKSKSSPVKAKPASPKKKKVTGKGKKSRDATKTQKGKRKAEDTNSGESDDDTDVTAPQKSNLPTGRRLSSAARMRAEPLGEEEGEKNESDSLQAMKSPRVKITILSPKASGSPAKGRGKQSKVASEAVTRSVVVSGSGNKEDEVSAKAPSTKSGKAVGKKAKKKATKSRK